MFLDKVKAVLRGLIGSNLNVELVKDYHEVFNSQAGERVLTDLMKFAKMVEPTYQPNDPHTSAYYEGMRRVGLRIFSFINTDLNRINELKQKQQEEQLND